MRRMTITTAPRPSPNRSASSAVAAARRFVTGVLHACPEATAPDDMVDQPAQPHP
ncbi:hypothetical protein GCM10022630_38930 [Thermobifida alba]